MKKTIKIIFFIIILIIIATQLINNKAFAASKTIEVYTAEELKNLAQANTNYSGTEIKLMQDIDLEGSQENQWTPFESFRGIFNGNGHVIKGIYIEATNDSLWPSYYGLIGENSGTVKDLGVEGNITIRGNGISLVGGICGLNFNRIVTCYSNITFTIFSDSAICGGIAGRSNGGGLLQGNGLVIGCYNKGDINVPNDIEDTYNCLGGIIGSLYNGEIDYCYNIGNINCKESSAIRNWKYMWRFF